MPDCMNFPDNIIDFIDDYSFEDSDHVYTNGSKLIQSFRVKQAVEHYLLREQEPVKPKWIDVEDPFTGDKFKVVEPQCGTCESFLPIDALYCPRCGKKVKWDA